MNFSSNSHRWTSCLKYISCVKDSKTSLQLCHALICLTGLISGCYCRDWFSGSIEYVRLWLCRWQPAFGSQDEVYAESRSGLMINWTMNIYKPTRDYYITKSRLYSLPTHNDTNPPEITTYQSQVYIVFQHIYKPTRDYYISKSSLYSLPTHIQTHQITM